MTPGECAKIDFGAALRRLPGPLGEHNVVVFEHGSLVIKLSQLRGVDRQQPHSRDEIYFVAQGSGEFVSGASRQSFAPKDVLFAAAGIEHRFENFSEDLAVWVIFFGPEGGEADQG